MRANGKYLVAVALLGVLAVVFGLAGAVAPEPQSVSLQSPSDSVTHFANPPTYDSGWIEVPDKAGQCLEIFHNLNSTDIIVDITGKTTFDNRTHQKNFGVTSYPGWARTYGKGSWPGNVAYSIVQTSDGGYAIAGYKDSGSPTYVDFWLVKTDRYGLVEWNETYGGPRDERIGSMIYLSGGGYAMAGTIDTGTLSSEDFMLVTTNDYGTLTWNRTYHRAGLSSDYANSVIETSDGFVVAGRTEVLTDINIWVVKIDGWGNVMWNKTYDNSDDYGGYVIQTTDGGYAIAGSTFNSSMGAYVFWLIKTDENGNVQWNQTYYEPGGLEHFAFSVIQTFDGGYALAGRAVSVGSTNEDFWLVKTDENGIMQWNRRYGGTGYDSAYSVIQTSDEGYVLAGVGFASVVKTDALGNLSWNQSYAGAAYSIVRTTDGGYAIAGRKFYDFWMAKTDIESGLAWIDTTPNIITLYRGATDLYWNFVRVRVWTIKEPTWIYGDINQDGVVDGTDLFILSQNYGKTFSALSLGGIVAVAGIYTYKKRKQPK